MDIAGASIKEQISGLEMTESDLGGRGTNHIVRWLMQLDETFSEGDSDSIIEDSESDIIEDTEI